MKRNFGAKFVLIFSLIVMSLWLANIGCSGSASPPSDQPGGSAQIDLSSRQIANGNVVLNSIAEQSVLIRNSGSTNLNVGQIAQANPLSLPFSIVNDGCSGRAVQPAAECSFTVQFSPTSQGNFNDNFDIPSNASNENPVTVDVSGNGKALRTAINQVKTDSCSTGILELIVTVTDQNNNPLAGLTLGNFQLTENLVSKEISSVTQSSTPVPISVATVLDYTASMQSRIPTIEAASKTFIGMLNAGDEAAIIKFATAYQLMQPFTGDKLLLTTAIDTAPSLIGSTFETHLYDTLWFAIDETAASLNTKAIVLISDGRDEDSQDVPNVSVKTLAEVIAHATGNGVAIYTAGLGNVEANVMTRLASETGGQYFPIASADQLTGVYQAIRNILSGQYSIKYISSLHVNPIMLTIDVVSGTDEGAGAREVVGCP